MANDADLAALAELRVGAAVGRRDFVVVVVGTGVGAGVVIEGKPRAGSRGMAGEIAFLPFRDEADAPLDPGGGFEALVGGRTLAARCAAQRARSEAAGEATSLRAGSTMAEALELAAGGDRAAARLIAQEATDLAMGIATVCALVDPELIVLSGGIGANPGLAAHVQTALSILVSGAPRVLTSPLGERAPLLGALEAARDAAKRPGPSEGES